jgi:methyl-accepting chemotaxis protein
LEGLLTLFVGLTAVAMLVQACILVSLYILSRRVAGQIELTLSQLRELMPPLKTVTENLKTVSEDVVEIGSAAREQFHRVEEMVGETGQALQSQLEKVDNLSREVAERVNETVDVVQDSIIRPVREVGALARGLTKGLEVFLNRKNRSTVDQAHSDDELFI